MAKFCVKLVTKPWIQNFLLKFIFQLGTAVGRASVRGTVTQVPQSDAENRPRNLASLASLCGTGRVQEAAVTKP
jgi:hypothetical protein